MKNCQISQAIILFSTDTLKTLAEQNGFIQKCVIMTDISSIWMGMLAIVCRGGQNFRCRLTALTNIAGTKFNKFLQTYCNIRDFVV